MRARPRDREGELESPVMMRVVEESKVGGSGLVVVVLVLVAVVAVVVFVKAALGGAGRDKSGDELSASEVALDFLGHKTGGGDEEEDEGDEEEDEEVTVEAKRLGRHLKT